MAMEHRTLRLSEHQYGHSLPAIHDRPLRPTPGVQQSPNHHPISHPPPPHPPPPPPSALSHSHSHRPSSALYHSPIHAAPHSVFAAGGRPDRAPENGFPGEGSGHVTPVNLPPPDIPSAQALHNTPDSSHPPSAPPMHQHADRPVDGLPATASIAYPHASAPLPPQSSYYSHVPIQITHSEPGPNMPAHMTHEHGGYHGQPPTPTYSLNPYPTAYIPFAAAPSNSQKKKGHRASQACEKCRERKSKCDENRPTCQGCRDQNIECVYRDNIPSKAVDKSLPPIMNEINEVLSRWTGHSDDVLNRLERIEALLREAASPSETKPEDMLRRDTPALESVLKTESFHSAVPASLTRSMSAQSQTPNAAPLHPQDATNATMQTTNKSDNLLDFDKHTTAAHKLLESWPSINTMVRNSFPKERDYVRDGEARGVLRLYGRGEAERPILDSLADMTQVENMAVDDMVDAPQTPNLWDECTTSPIDCRRSEGLLDTQQLDLRGDTVWKLVNLYRKNIHDLHPFLDMPTLEGYLFSFIERHKPAGGGPASPYSTANGESNRKKRKRSEPFPCGIVDSPAQSCSNLSGGSVKEVSLPAAITYLVLALGRIVEWQDIVPGPVYGNATSTSMPPPRVPYGASPSAASRPSPSSSRGAPTPPSVEARGLAPSPRHSFESSVSGARHVRGGNVDEMPGLDYYREACHIIGLHTDSNELWNAQARLLAGLYKGQLGRVQESWSWISDACRICRYQIRMHGFDKGTAVGHVYKALETKAGTLENTVLITCWSALQLESDIVAELDYPHSGLSSVQDTMPYPRIPGTSADQQPMMYYTKQLYLRKRLNEMHSNLFGNHLPFTTPQHLAITLEHNERSLQDFRTMYHDWDDKEPPAENILEARVRAKFYGAKYVCLRPYLDYVLHAMRDGGSLESCARDAYGFTRHNELKLYAAIAKMPKERITERAKHCVEAAILSTEAFDRVPGRLIVTNIVGTSHAQFSNMLVLSAAHNSGTLALRDLIPAPRLKGLLKRTIRFIGKLRHCSPTANQDITILRAIYQYIFDEHAEIGEGQEANGSFASDISTVASTSTPRAGEGFGIGGHWQDTDGNGEKY